MSGRLFALALASGQVGDGFPAAGHGDSGPFQVRQCLAFHETLVCHGLRASEDAMALTAQILALPDPPTGEICPPAAAGAP